MQTFPKWDAVASWPTVTVAVEQTARPRSRWLARQTNLNPFIMELR